MTEFDINQQEQPRDVSLETEIMQSGYSDRMPMSLESEMTIGGNMGCLNSDFQVSEIPAYMPCGEGEHVYLWIEKNGKATQDVAKMLERLFQVREIDVGCAGKKDVHAITRQWFSVQTGQDPASVIEQINQMEGVRVLTSTRHTNKIRMGHLRGNLFRVSLYDVVADDECIQRACDRLLKRGFVNYFGKQRFGFDGSNVSQGIRMLSGGKARNQMKKLYVSALQSAVFNLAASRRYLNSGFQVMTGDVVQKINAGCFVCDDPETDNGRAAAGEVAVTLGLPGKKYMRGRGQSDAFEQQVLKDVLDYWSSRREDGGRYEVSELSRLADGTRRTFWERPDNLSFRRLDERSISIEFALSSGSYATIFLRHLCGSSFTR